MNRRKQFEFSGEGFARPSDSFGGGRSHAKSKRPLDSRFPLHLVLRSDHARGDYSFRHPRHFEKVNAKVRRVAAKYGVTIHDYANVGNHLHLLIHLRGRETWNAFVRELSAKIMAIVCQRKGRAKAALKFWTQKPFTRIVRGWGKALLAIRKYFRLNRLEGEGKMSRLKRPRQSPLSSTA